MRRRDLVLVASGLEQEGGGRAVVGRLLARSGAAWARERGIGYSILHLGSAHPLDDCLPVASFGGDPRALALAVWRRQLRRPRPALLFDLLGPARLQAWWPPALRSPYGVMLLGIEVFGALGGARRRALRGAARRLAISEHTRRQVLPWLAPDDGDVAVLPLTLEEPAAGDGSPGVLAAAGEGFLLIVGRMDSGERYKGHDELLAALPDVAARCPGARLVVAGDGDDRRRLEAQAAARGIGERVLFTGFVDPPTLAELYRRAAVFAMPSRGEGFGLVYLEAMREGKPCVAARGCAAGEVVEDGVSGLLVDPAAPGELTAALLRLLGDGDYARRLGEAGRRRFAERFSRRRFEGELWRHLDGLTGAGSEAPAAAPSRRHPPAAPV